MTYKKYKSGFVAIIGPPNAGKSTLINHILGEKVAIISPKPQTTRNRLLGIKTMGNAQIILLDTPGLHNVKTTHLNKFMVETALGALNNADLIIYMSDGLLRHGLIDQWIINFLNQLKTPVIAAINKIDSIPKKTDILPRIEHIQKELDPETIIPISALKGDGIAPLIEEIIRLLPEGPQYYPEDMYTDLSERFLVSEIIREKVFLLTKEEIPYTVAVTIESFKKNPKKNIIKIQANIYVEKNSQKAIIIGKQGAMLKDIGIAARKDMETMLNSKIYLETWVKIQKKWRDSPDSLKRFGYK